MGLWGSVITIRFGGFEPGCSFSWEKFFVVTKILAKLTPNPLAKEQASSEYNKPPRHAYSRRAHTTASMNGRRTEWGCGCVSVTFTRQMILSVNSADALERNCPSNFGTLMVVFSPFRVFFKGISTRVLV